MTPIRSCTLNASSDPPVADQTSNGVYPVRPKISVEICRRAEA